MATPLARAAFNENRVTVFNNLTNPRRSQGNPVFVCLDLSWDANSHAYLRRTGYRLIPD